MLLVNLALTGACASTPAPAEYPDTKLTARSLSLDIDDARKGLFDTYTEAPVMNRNEEDTYPQALPKTFVDKAKQRLAKLSSGRGPKVLVHTEVRRCDVTFYNNEYRGDFVRYDVVLGFKVTTEGGALLDKGSGGLWQELDAAQATSAEMQRVFLETALGAFDKYFASEEVLDAINENLERYLQTHPDER